MGEVDVDGVGPVGVVVDVLDHVPDAIAGAVVIGDEEGCRRQGYDVVGGAD